MEEIYESSKNIFVDESMVLWRERLIFRQFMKNKKLKYGVKMYMLTEPRGLIHRVLIYSGQGYDVSNSMYRTKYVVEKLMIGLLYKGRSLYVDNFYNSVQLSQKC